MSDDSAILKDAAELIASLGLEDSPLGDILWVSALGGRTVIVGVVGAEAAKFTPLGRVRAKQIIADHLLKLGATEVVSGACHLGGIDIWAIEAAKELGIPYIEFPPVTHSWHTGYKPRNLQIASRSDVVICIAVDTLPKEFKGMRFPRCYHCDSDGHVKSGGCWTMRQAQKMGKHHILTVVRNYE